MPAATFVMLPARWHISPRLMACWPIDDDHTLELEPVERTDDGRIRWRYRLARRDRTIFSGADLRSGVGAELTTDAYAEAALNLLNFLLAGSAETEVYTATQSDWLNSHGEELEIYAVDELCGYCGSEEHITPACPVS